jgi:hypothetical protein
MVQQPNNRRSPWRKSFKTGGDAHDGTGLDFSAVTLIAVIPNCRFATFKIQRSARMLASSRSARKRTTKTVSLFGSFSAVIRFIANSCSGLASSFSAAADFSV